MDDLITRAQEKREWHLQQAAKLETFLATYFDLEQELKTKVPEEKTDAEKVEAPKRQRQIGRPAPGTVGAETINAAEMLVLEHGPLSTRDMLPMIRARGIEVGGKDPLATLSARLSGRGDLVVQGGKWQFKDKEEADIPAKDTSASSVFVTSQGGPHGTALTN